MAYYDLQNNGHGHTGLLKEEMAHCGFTQEQIDTLCLSFAKRGLIVVDASDLLEQPHLHSKAA